MKNVDSTQDKRRDILEAAEKVFRANGFTAAKMDEIAELAGVAKGTLYLYFDSKQDLFVSLLEDRIWEYVATLTKKLEEVCSVQGFVQTLAKVRGQLFVKNRWLLESLSHSLPDFSKEFRMRIWNLRKGLEEPTIEALTRLLPPDYPIAPLQAAAMVNGALDYTVGTLILHGQPVVLEDVARALEYILLPGLSQAPGEDYSGQ
ncbi:MAG: TetR/AcrR family transcriptional regulator [Firmicutes bacterium]|nr:TetR/AcrR family transcriptional regulator [Bacillota bacterium]